MNKPMHSHIADEEIAERGITETSTKKEKGLVRRVATKIGAYVLAGSIALGAALGVEQFGSPIQRYVGKIMVEHEQGILEQTNNRAAKKLDDILDQLSPVPLKTLVQQYAQERSDGTITLLDRTKTPFAERPQYQGKVVQDRTRVIWKSLDEISPYLVAATVAAEDRRFEHHGAWDPAAAISAAADIAAARVQGKKTYPRGASTITIQLADNLLCPAWNPPYACTADNKLVHKIREWLLAAKIESVSSKKDILETYLNSAYFGYEPRSKAHLVGVEAAAQHYFGKQAVSLDAGESVLLVAMIKKPSRYGTRAYADFSQGKQSTPAVNGLVQRAQYAIESFGEMSRNGEFQQPYYAAIKQDDVQRIIAQLHYRNLPFVRPTPATPRERAYEFEDVVLQQLEKLKLPAHGDVTIETTLDPGLQDFSRDVLRRSIEKIRASGAPKPEYLNGSIVVVDTENQELLSVVGGLGIDRNDYINRALRRTSVGSGFKPFITWMYLEQGGHITDTFKDAPKVLTYQFAPGKTKTYRPGNFKGHFSYQNITLEQALAESKNTIFAEVNFNLIRDVGAEKMKHALNMLGLGLEQYWLSSVLGTEVAPLDFAGAFSIFANGGTVHLNETGMVNLDPLKKIVYHDPTTGAEKIYPETGTTYAAITPQHSETLDHALRKVVVEGTGKRADITGYDIRGKTGTGLASFMFVGYEPALDRLVLVQFSSDEPAATGRLKLTGGEWAAPAAKEIFQYMIDHQKQS